MLRHVVLFKWNEDATDDDKLAVEQGLAALPPVIPQIQRYEFGPDAGLAEGNFDFIVVADFASQADYETYQAHPDHLQVIQEHIRPAISARAGAQYHLPETGGGAPA